ncbi:hypothetical protein NKDENANG_03255 [Candidatus Entotheonellaceae bacterium PAL068K]
MYTRIVLSCLLIWLGGGSRALAWGPVAHAVIGQLAEQYLLERDPGLHTLLTRLRAPANRSQVEKALLHMAFPEPGAALRVFANWADWYKRQPGMLAHDGLRHFVNLPHRARYHRARHCPDGVCSIETLLQQRAILADPHAPLTQRAVALAWVTHLIGDLHQPLHAGRAEDRGGNLTCVVWQGRPSRLVSINGKLQCNGANLHAVWDSKIIKAATGFMHPNDAPTYARKLQQPLKPVQAAERPLLARTEAGWRAAVEGWHSETQALILSDHIYPRGNTIDRFYIQSHYRTIRQQLLRAAVRLAAMLHHTLNP